MPSDRDWDDPDWNRRIAPDGDHRSWSDRCDVCGHSRADHSVHPDVKSFDAVRTCTATLRDGPRYADQAAQAQGIVNNATKVCGCIGWQKN